MNLLIIICLLIFYGQIANAQMPIKDKHVTNQQERMVFKQWDRKKFTPTSGFLGLNPEYWLTWAWHPNYPKTDLRPLSSTGQQTQRLALVAAMQNIENAYKLHSDSLKNVAVTESSNFLSVLSSADPLWMLYYRHKFNYLLNEEALNELNSVPIKIREYLTKNGAYQWYLRENQSLLERLDAARTTTMDRGARILTYHRYLNEYRLLMSTWGNKIQYAKTFINLSESNANIKSPKSTLLDATPVESQKQIADRIVNTSNFK